MRLKEETAKLTKKSVPIRALTVFSVLQLLLCNGIHLLWLIHDLLEYSELYS